MSLASANNNGNICIVLVVNNYEGCYMYIIQSHRALLKYYDYNNYSAL